MFFHRDMKNFTVQEYQSVHCLAAGLRLQRYPALQGVRKRSFSTFLHLAWVSIATMKSQVTQNPVAIALLSPVCIMRIAQHFFDLLHKFSIRIGFKFLDAKRQLIFSFLNALI